jgi:hypothetical protein
VIKSRRVRMWETRIFVAEVQSESHGRRRRRRRIILKLILKYEQA